MRIREWLIIPGLTLALLLALAGCGGGNGGGASTPVNLFQATPQGGDEPQSAPVDPRPGASGWEADRETLTVVFNALGLSEYVSDAPLDVWGGVEMDYDGGYVVRLSLYQSELSGKIPPELGDFSRLEYLDIIRGSDGLSGCVPAKLEAQLEFAFLGDFAFCIDDPAEAQAAAMTAVYTALDMTGWDSNAPLSEWPGVDIDDDGRVIELDLWDYQLRRALPPELGGLSDLQALYFGNNRFVGEIPPELGDLPNLTSLDLGNNELSGEIPPELGNLSALRFLELHGNMLRGEIPPELGNLSDLQVLLLGNNQLSGEIPPELGNLSNLTRLSVRFGRLVGGIPPEIGDLSNLTYLSLSYNELSGGIPPELGNLSNLIHLGLDGNRLSGCVPAVLEAQLESAELGGLAFC